MSEYTEYTEQEFNELLEKSLNDMEMRIGELVTGVVLDVDKDHVHLHVGLKSETSVPVSQFKGEYDGDSIPLQPGDTVQVVLESVDDGDGMTRVSRERARRNEAWQMLERAFTLEEAIPGRITGKVKGGLTVDVNTIRAFLPGSLADVRPLVDTGYLENTVQDFKVIKLDRRNNNVVVSRRAVLEDINSGDREKLLANLEEGQIVEGIVKNLTEYGAFVDLGGIDGLLHITDMAWKHVNKPSDIVEVGQQVKLRVLRYERERKRISLGLKQLQTDPWADIEQRFQPGDKVTAQVTNITEYGFFAEIQEGVEGLVHVSEMSWVQRTPNPATLVEKGQQVEVMVLEINTGNRRISLGMKQCLRNPWEEFASTHKQGDKVKGEIRTITDFGLFITLSGGMDGLVHLSDISWDQQGDEAVKEFNKGDKLEVVVLGIDVKHERVSLGLKQLEGNPVGDFMESNPPGSTVKGQVATVSSRSLRVTLAERVLGSLDAHHATGAAEKPEDLTTLFNEGDEVEALVIGLDRASAPRLSVRALLNEDEREAILAKAMPEEQQGDATTVGDLVRREIDQKKAQEEVDKTTETAVETETDATQAPESEEE